jgi:hypothetical protein
MSVPLKGELIIATGTRKVMPLPYGTDNQILITNTQSPNNVSFVDSNKKYFSAYDAGGAINLNSGFTAITWDTESYKDADYYTHSADSANVTVLKTGIYKITVNLSITTALSLTQATSTARLEIDTGGGFTALAGTTSVTNLGTVAGGSGCVVSAYFGTISAGNVLRATAERTTGSGTVTTLANGCRILIETY